MDGFRQAVPASNAQELLVPQNIGWTDIATLLNDAFKAVLYRFLSRPTEPLHPDKTYSKNLEFWQNSFSGDHYSTQYITLNGFTLLEWLPFSPGRYHLPRSARIRADAGYYRTASEYLPAGKGSLVTGGVGSIRLAEKDVGGRTLHFLGATSSGTAHEGLPVALPGDVYHNVMPRIKEAGGCTANITGQLQILTDDWPTLLHDHQLPRYCFVAEDVVVEDREPSRDLRASVAVMYGNPQYVDDKSWTFCTFDPRRGEKEVRRAAEWIADYAQRYGSQRTTILTDFDEHYHHFPNGVEFPLVDIVRGTVDWETLRVYRKFLGTTYIERYVHVSGDQITNNVSAGRDIVGTVIGRDVSGANIEASQAAVAEDVKTLLATLAQQIEELKPLIGLTAKSLSDDLEVLGKEVAKPEPRKQWYELSLTGLKEAAESLGAIAAPVLTTVSQLRGLLLP